MNLNSRIIRILSTLSRSLSEVDRELRTIDRLIMEPILSSGSGSDAEVDWLGAGMDVAMSFVNPFYGGMKLIKSIKGSQLGQESELRNAKQLRYYADAATSAMNFICESVIPAMIAQTNLFAFEWVMGVFENEGRILGDIKNNVELVSEAYARRIARLVAWADFPIDEQEKRKDVIGRILNLPKATNSDIFTQI